MILFLSTLLRFCRTIWLPQLFFMAANKTCICHRIGACLYGGNKCFVDTLWGHILYSLLLFVNHLLLEKLKGACFRCRLLRERKLNQSFHRHGRWPIRTLTIHTIEGFFRHNFTRGYIAGNLSLICRVTTLLARWILRKRSSILLLVLILRHVLFFG